MHAPSKTADGAERPAYHPSAATAAMVMENGLVRVTFDGPIGASDVITASNISDLAGNVTASIAFDPID